MSAKPGSGKAVTHSKSASIFGPGSVKMPAAQKPARFNNIGTDGKYSKGLYAGCPGGCPGSKR